MYLSTIFTLQDTLHYRIIFKSDLFNNIYNDLFNNIYIYLIIYIYLFNNDLFNNIYSFM